uniref:Ion transport domain-containing protein n=1 Tax=Guillardia theta TaxID=55529 RepID=A0A7S4H881_GUITH
MGFPQAISLSAKDVHVSDVESFARMSSHGASEASCSTTSSYEKTLVWGAPMSHYEHVDSHSAHRAERHRGMRTDQAAESDPAAHAQLQKELRAKENWDTMISEVARKMMANGGLGRKICINSGGMVCITYEKYLRRYPGTLLSDMIRNPNHDLFRKGFIFLDRHPFAAVEIVNSYRDGFIPVKPPHIASEVWQNELLYFKMHEADPPIPGLDGFLALYRQSFNSEEDGRPSAGFRATLYALLEEPKSSTLAWFISMTSLILVVASVVVLCVETLPQLAKNDQLQSTFEFVDVGFVSAFTFEYLSRLLVNQNKRKFVFRPLNIIDLLSILPTWITLIFPAAEASKVLKVLRILRVFKLARHSDGLQVLGKTAIAARNELSQALFCFIILVILFAAIVFYAEDNAANPYGEPFLSIPHSMWWAVITLCTIGYGDMTPVTDTGRLFGSMACVAGVVMVALPISVISSTFQEKYAEHMEKQKIEVPFKIQCFTPWPPFYFLDLYPFLLKILADLNRWSRRHDI